MKALLCKEFGPPESLVIEEVPTPEPGPGEIRIQVHACVLNPNDLLKIKGEHHERPQPPFTPSSEVVGLVDAVGPGVTRFRQGDRVIAMMEGTIGGMAEMAVTSEILAVHCPATMDDDMACTLLGSHATAYEAVVLTAKTTHEDTVLVMGAGSGVGLCAVEIAHALGSTVIAVASSAQKIQNARTAGADHLINYSEIPFGDAFRAEVFRLTAGKGVNVVIDPVGGDAFRQSFRCLAWQGRVAITGFTARDIPEVKTILLLLKGVNLLGANLYHTAHRDPAKFRAACDQLFRWHIQGRIQSRVTHTFPLDQVSQAMRLIAGRDYAGKVAIHVRER